MDKCPHVSKDEPNIDVTKIRTIHDMHKLNKHPVQARRQITGFILFIAIFVVCIPIILFKFHYYTLLEAYLPNIDLLANSLSWHGGPNGIWKDLYLPLPNSWYSFTSQNIINYIAILGLTYIIARETLKTKSIIKGWSIGFIMILMTYLLPGHFISIAMDNITHLFPQSISKILVTICGLIVSSAIIFGESKVIYFTRDHLEALGKTITNFPKRF